jgi:hypothetical protein
MPKIHGAMATLAQISAKMKKLRVLPIWQSAKIWPVFTPPPRR